MREDAMTAVEPAVRPPNEAVECLVRVFQSPAIENDPRRTGRLVLALLDRNEEQLRRLADPDTAEAEFHTRDEVQAFVEDGSLVEHAVSVGILEDEDAILR